ncbi:MAG: diguanylate cyclase [Firmicutes bacterium]|nr:diguanylate cyclase [Bacillota bacterium]
MTIPEKDRSNDINEYITGTHMFCLVILFSVLIFDNNKFSNNIYPGINVKFCVLLIIISCGVVLLYNTRGYFNSKGNRSFYCLDYIYVSFPLLVAILILFISEEYILYREVVLFLPIFVAASLMGKIPGLIMSTVCCIVMTTYNINIMNQNFYQAINESIFVLSSMYVAGWFIGGISDIELKHRKQLAHMANTDMLSGLYNHRYFQEQLKRHFKKVSENNPLSLIIVDIDYFKHYNDGLGHVEGDNVIKIIGGILRDEIAKPGFAARYGGEEFVAVLPGCSSKKAMKIAEGIRTKVENQSFYGGNYQPGGKVTISCGISTSPTHAISSRELIKQADYALYRAKNIKKNKVELYFSVFDDLELGENEKELINSIKTLVSVINAKDRYTYGHSERVTDYSVKLATKVGVAEDDIKLLQYAAFLHDIGKIEIDRDTLNSPHRLSEKQWTSLKQHPQWGSDIVKSVSTLTPIVPVILYHHENYDGSGYPQGLKGQDIPLLARIVRIADSYDAMTSHRPYKRNLTPEEAIQEIERCSGTMFDPILVKHVRDVIFKVSPSEKQINPNGLNL